MHITDVQRREHGELNYSTCAVAPVRFKSRMCINTYKIDTYVGIGN